MGRLDKRTSNEEDDRSARGATERRRVSRAEQLREAQAAAARTAAQETLVDEVYELVNEFLELMEEKGYPGLETVTLPMTRWWWPFPRPTRKAVWTLYSYPITRDVMCYEGDRSYTVPIREDEIVYLVADEGTLTLRKAKTNESSGGIIEEVFYGWRSSHAEKVRDGLKQLIAQYSR